MRNHLNFSFNYKIDQYSRFKPFFCAYIYYMLHGIDFILIFNNLTVTLISKLKNERSGYQVKF